jgi:hypothetical protein
LAYFESRFRFASAAVTTPAKRLFTCSTKFAISVMTLAFTSFVFAKRRYSRAVFFAASNSGAASAANSLSSLPASVLAAATVVMNAAINPISFG